MFCLWIELQTKWQGKKQRKTKKEWTLQSSSYCSLIFCCTFAVWVVRRCYINVTKALTHVEQPGRFRRSSHLTVIQLQNQGKDNTYDLSLLLYFCCCWFTASVGWIFLFWKLRPSIIVKAMANFAPFCLSPCQSQKLNRWSVRPSRRSAQGKLPLLFWKSYL